MRARSSDLAAREHRRLIDGQRILDVSRPSGYGLAELGFIKHRQVCAVAHRRRQMRGIAEQRHAWGTIPLMTNRQRVDGSQDRHRVAAGDQCAESRSPCVDNALE